MTAAAREDTHPAEQDVIRTYLRTQLEVVVRGEEILLAGGNAVHDTRVAIRRIRSVIRVFADMVDPTGIAELDQELLWYATSLGTLRDREVLRARVGTGFMALSDLPGQAEAADLVDRRLGSELAVQQAELMRALSSPRYRGLVPRLRTWVDSDPPTTGPKRRKRAIVQAVARAERVARRRIRRAVRHSTDIDALHRARKAAKRARYAVEAAFPLMRSKQAGRQARRFTAVQELLGEHRDALISADCLRSQSASDPEAGFALGALYMSERAHTTGIGAALRRLPV